MEIKHPLYIEIQQGESKVLEFKQQLPKGDALAKTLVAFANTAGGKLIIGVDDQRGLIGLGDVDIFELKDRVSSIIYDYCAPTLLPEIYIENINNVELLVIEVFRGPSLPYYLKQQGKAPACYIRLAATNRVAGQEKIAELELQRRNISFDEQIDYEVELDQLDLTPLTSRFNQLNKSLDQQQLLNLKLIKYDRSNSANKLYPTIGLLILLGHYEHVEIKCSRFKGNTMAVFIDKKEYSNDIFSQLEQAEAFIKNHLHLHAEVLGLQRTDTYEIPIPAIREALLNAVMHRDYSNVGRDIKIGVYDDILNIVSPGGLPNGLTMSDVLKGRSEIRNTVIARVFKQLNLVEQWGSGIARIKQYCQDTDVALPTLTETGDFIDWEFPRINTQVVNKNKSQKKPLDNKTSTKAIDKLGDRLGDRLGDGLGDRLGDNRKKIMIAIMKNNTISATELAHIISISKTAIENNIKWLKKHNYIKRHGSAKTGHWEVLDHGK